MEQYRGRLRLHALHPSIHPSMIPVERESLQQLPRCRVDSLLGTSIYLTEHLLERCWQVSGAVHSGS
jgi:hypothetical protein